MINWNAFKEKFDKREQWAFEQMSYFLFCSKLNNSIGAFRYKNQPGIETDPILYNGKFYGFQAKYYEIQLSQKKDDIIESVEKAKNSNPKPDVIILYVNQELSKNKKGDPPKYQIDIEQTAQKISIKVEWSVPSHIEYQLSKPQNKWIFDIFFGKNGLDPDFFKNQIEKEVRNLGPRFNEKLNFKLPIVQVFDSLAHNNTFFNKFIKIIDNWLTEKGHRQLNSNEHLSELEKELESLRKELTNWIKSYEYKIDCPIILNDFLERLHLLNEKIDKKRDELYRLIDVKKSASKFDVEISRLRDIERNNDDFLSGIESLNINLIKNPTLIIQGEAGCGKSHLLGDIATLRKEQLLPSIFLLGTTFNNSRTIEKNILDKLDLDCSFKEFLTNLNSIGNTINSRVLILIDAINEGAGADLWKNQISGFVHEIAKYPAIGLVFTVRSTYFNDIIPTNLRSDKKITFLTHEGFKGNEYGALKMFCEHYNLDLPNFPMLNHEYSNPLFLDLICKATKIQQERSFPKGFTGIHKTYSLYKEALNLKFDEKRHEYKNRNIVSLAIEKFANKLLNTDYGQLECNDAFSFFDKEFPQFPHLLTDLIEECVFIKMRSEYDKSPKDFVFFSYQKLGDFFIAEEIIKPFTGQSNIKDAFANDPKFLKILKEFHWTNRGVMEVLSILLPERYDLELFEFIEFFTKKKQSNNIDDVWDRSYIAEKFTYFLLGSLKWREIKYINNKK